MIRKAMLAGLVLAVAAGIAAIALLDDPQPPPVQGAAADRQTLAVLTSLPLIFGESFGLAGGSATLSRIEQRYQVEPIGVADAPSLAGHRILLMAHPRAQPAEALVDLDRWINEGGKLLLLADPKLDWNSERPLGDNLRAPLAFADTGLLGHWGLKLANSEDDGPATAGNGNYSILASSPGRLSSDGRCSIAGSGFVARCRIGNGAAIVIADADFLNVEGEGALDGGTDHNLDLLMDELARLETL